MSDPTSCPFCEGNVTFIEVPDVEAWVGDYALDEWQCKNEDCGRSFWV